MNYKLKQLAGQGRRFMLQLPTGMAVSRAMCAAAG